MAIATECQTPGTVFQTRVTGNIVSVRVELPDSVPVAAVGLLEANIHNALELVLAVLFSVERAEERHAA